MENASKALLMGAGILIGILLIAVAVRMYTSASEVTKSFQSIQNISEIRTFNSNFARFVGAKIEKDLVNNDLVVGSRGYATIYDIVSVANFVWDYNNQQVYNLKKLSEQEQEPENDPRIVHINIRKTEAKDNNYYIKNLQNYNDKAQQMLLQSGYYANNDAPSAKYTVDFQIDIIRYNAEGKIIVVDFYPTTTVATEFTGAFADIEAEPNKYKR